jgi:acyl carrier protein
MDKSEVERRVRKVVSHVLKVDDQMITPESDFVFDLGAESVQSVQLVAAFEAEFGLEMDNEAALKVQTVSGAVDFISRHVK